LQQLQTLDERRTVSIQGYMKKAAEIHRQVLPIVGKCLDGIVVAADSIDAKKDAEIVIERYKSGFVPADDFPFEDLSVTKNCDSSSTTGSTLTAYRGDTVRGTLSAGKKKRSGLFGIFSSNKHNIEEFKDDYSDLPPNQRRKKLMQEIDKTKAQIHTFTQAREGLFKLKGSYEQNVALGDPQTVQGEINDLGIRLEKLQTDLEKYQVGSSPLSLHLESYRLHRAFSFAISKAPPKRTRREICGRSSLQTYRMAARPRERARSRRGGNFLMSSRGRTCTSATMRDAPALTYGYVSDHERVNGTLTPPKKCRAQSEGSIPMEEGEEFLVVEVDQGDGWTRVRRENLEEGFVPTSYLEVTMFNSC
ncbi:unnamed protein product, partial [Ixodes persulcatus]